MFSPRYLNYTCYHGRSSSRGLDHPHIPLSRSKSTLVLGSAVKLSRSPTAHPAAGPRLSGNQAVTRMTPHQAYSECCPGRVLHVGFNARTNS